MDKKKKREASVMIEGIDDAAIDQPEVKTLDPQTSAESKPEVPKELDERFIWPKDKAMPSHHVRRQAMPCPSCRRVLMDSGVQASVLLLSQRDCAFYRCRCCQHRWKMPIRD